MRYSKTIEFEAELFGIHAILPMVASGVVCACYFLLTQTPPNVWVVGVSLNICWVMSLRESMLTSYLQGHSDAVMQSPYLKPYLKAQIPPYGQATEPPIKVK